MRIHPRGLLTLPQLLAWQSTLVALPMLPARHPAGTVGHFPEVEGPWTAREEG